MHMADGLRANGFIRVVGKSGIIHAYLVSIFHNGGFWHTWEVGSEF